MNMYDEMFEENDFDEDIKLREELIEEAKQLSEEDDLATILRTANELQRRWKRIAFWDSAYEEKLREQFDAVLDVFYAKQNALYKTNETLKQELIEEAKKLVKATNFKEATHKVNDLMQQWKAIGSAGRNTDDALWDAFNDARNQFFAKKGEHWDRLQDKFANAKTTKEALIEKAKAIADSEDWQATGALFRDLMQTWKEVGSAGREVEDTLWDSFNAYRQHFYTRRDAHFAAMQEQFDANYELKSELLKEAEAISTSAYYSRENTQVMKELGVKWKAVGSCGKERENALWEAFRGTMDAYFAGLKQYNSQKQEQWRQNIIEARTRKLELIQKQKRQIKHMQDEMVGLLGERAIYEMEEAIQEKEEFIKHLEEEAQELEDKLAQ